MVILKTFVIEIRSSIYVQASSTIATYEVSALDHKVLFDSMDGRAFIAKWVSAKSIFPSAELSEILCCFW